MADHSKPPLVDARSMDKRIFADDHVQNWLILAATKQTYREAVWDHLEKYNIADFPRPVHHRIPNFKGAAIACDKCATLDAYKNASIIKINPDKPQEQIRFLSLVDGKCLLVPTPRLEHGLFNRIVPPPGANQQMMRKCATKEGVRNYSKPIGLNDQVNVDVIVIGCTAVSPSGLRLGKGEGYAELEYGMMRTMGAVGDNTSVICTVHDCQVFDELPEHLFDFRHDLPVDYICTPTRIIKCTGNYQKPQGIVWSLLTNEQLARMPILRTLRTMEEKKGVDVNLNSD